MRFLASGVRTIEMNIRDDNPKNLAYVHSDSGTPGRHGSRKRKASGSQPPAPSKGAGKGKGEGKSQKKGKHGDLKTKTREDKEI